MRRIGSRPPRRAIQAPRVWSPLDLGEKLKIWLTADYGITLADGAIISWASRVGTYVVSQSVAASRPILSQIGDRNFVAFDGVDDFLTGTTNLDQHLSMPPANLEIWSAMIFDGVNDGSGFYGSVAARTQSSNRFSLVASSTSSRFVVCASSGATIIATSGVPGTGLVVRFRGSVGPSGGIQRCKIGNHSEGTVTSGGQHSGNYDWRLRLGRDDDTTSRYLDGAIRHVFAFDDELTSAERDRLDAWLVNDCGAQV